MMRMLGRIARTAHQECYAMFLLVGILVQVVSDRDVHTFLFVLLRGVVSPCIVSGVVDLRDNRNNKSV